MGFLNTQRRVTQPVTVSNARSVYGKENTSLLRPVLNASTICQAALDSPFATGSSSPYGRQPGGARSNLNQNSAQGLNSVINSVIGGGTGGMGNPLGGITGGMGNPLGGAMGAAVGGAVIGAAVTGAVTSAANNNRNNGYNQPNQGYNQPNQGYNQQNQGYNQPNQGYNQPNQGYNQPNQGYNQPNQGYNQPNNGMNGGMNNAASGAMGFMQSMANSVQGVIDRGQNIVNQSRPPQNQQGFQPNQQRPMGSVSSGYQQAPQQTQPRPTGAVSSGYQQPNQPRPAQPNQQYNQPQQGMTQNVPPRYPQNSAPQPAAPPPPPAPKRRHPQPGSNVLRKGQKWAVADSSGAAIKKLKVCVGWEDPGYSCDIDMSAFLLGEGDKVLSDEWFVFYGQEQSPDGSVKYKSNKEDMTRPDDVELHIDLDSVYPNVQKIPVCVTIYEAAQRRHHFGLVRNLYARVLDDKNNEVTRFSAGSLSSGETALVLGELYRYKGAWKFNAVGSGYKRELAEFCRVYGVELE